MPPNNLTDRRASEQFSRWLGEYDLDHNPSDIHRQ
jgi:hypothetical protein